MKTRFWIAIIAALVLICTAATVLLFRPGTPADSVTILSEGKVLYTLPLSIDRTVQITSANGTNTVTIQDGKVAVTEADCPDRHCMARGYCDNGASIVCLPNRLVIQFADNAAIDGVVG